MGVSHKSSYQGTFRKKKFSRNAAGTGPQAKLEAMPSASYLLHQWEESGPHDSYSSSKTRKLEK